VKRFECSEIRNKIGVLDGQHTLNDLIEVDVSYGTWVHVGKCIATP
jgi:hypothetical protein